MNDPMQGVFRGFDIAASESRMKTFWARLGGGQRMTVASVMLATIVGLGAILWYSSQPDYRTLKNFSDPLAMVEAEAALEAKGIPFVAIGSEIQVDSDDHEYAWSTLFKAELTGSDADFSSTPISNLVPDRDTRLQMINDENRRKAERAVRTFDAITAVGVTASKPKLSPFSSMDDLYAPSATATISLRPGADFAKVPFKGQHQAIGMTRLPILIFALPPVIFQAEVVVT